MTLYPGFTAVLLAVVMLAMVSCSGTGLVSTEPSAPNVELIDPNAKSTDLKNDIREMWKTQRLENDTGHYASTDRAIAAAARVFNTVRLAGKTIGEVTALLGDPVKSSNSQYNFPFWPVEGKALVYRFDCGSFGLQFDVLLDRHSKVKKVVRRWIH